MSTEAANSASKKTKGGFTYAAVTMLLIGAASTLTQLITASSLELPVVAEWSTGGLIALCASLWMWIQCRSWAQWRRWVWIPFLVVIVTAIVTVNLQAAEFESERECSATKAALASKQATHEQLLDETWRYQRNWTTRPAEWRPQPGTGSETAPNSNWQKILESADARPTPPSQGEVWAFYVAYDGPKLETEIRQEASEYAVRCGFQ